jgi:hypothetical protein
MTYHAFSKVFGWAVVHPAHSYTFCISGCALKSLMAARFITSYAWLSTSNLAARIVSWLACSWQLA